MTRLGHHATRGSRGAAADLVAAFEHHKAGQLDRAETLYRKVLRKMPSNPDALQLLGVIALDRGYIDRAIQLIGKAVAINPNLALAHSNLGNALLASGRVGDAIASYRRAISLEPRFAAAHCNLGKALDSQGSFSAAVESCRRAVELDPGMADAYNNLGNALRGDGRLEDSVVALRHAVALAPRRVDLHTNVGNVQLELQRFDAAMTSFRRAIEIDPKYARSHYGLAACLRFVGEMDAALESYRRALTLDPNQATIWNDIGNVFRALGRFDEAIDAFQNAIAVAPDFADPYRNLAACRSLATDKDEFARVSVLATREDLPVDERVAAGFALGKALDDADRYDEAFAAYENANRLFHDLLAAQGHAFDAEALRRLTDETIARFTPEFFASMKGKGDPSELPVFIVGMPRSGTSLVEQIAASHSRVSGAGELSDIGEIAGQLVSRGTDGAHPDWDAAELGRHADAHLDRLRRLGGSAERVIDKMPDNIFKLGVIAALFPSARVICCRRDARDTGLSCYFQKFSGRQLAFSYDLADCGRRYRETERLTAYWHRALPLRTLDVQYETLVDDLEGQSRRLISFLGLHWEAACLDFHRTERTVKTASSWQVRQPLYRRAVGRWKHYANHLSALIAELDPGTVHCHW